jgi:hypothetical protein
MYTKTDYQLVRNVVTYPIRSSLDFCMSAREDDGIGVSSLKRFFQQCCIKYSFRSPFGTTNVVRDPRSNKMNSEEWYKETSHS